LKHTPSPSSYLESTLVVSDTVGWAEADKILYQPKKGSDRIDTITKTVENLVAKHPILLASDEDLVTNTADEINSDTVDDVVSPILEAAFDTGTTTSSPEITVERRRPLRLSAGKQARVPTVEAVKAEHNTTPRIASSSLRGNAEEFIPGQAYSPSIGSPEESFSKSSSTPLYDVRMDARSTSHPAALQMTGARPQHPVPSPRVIQLFPSKWATRSPRQHPFPAIAGPYKYSRPKSSPASRERSPPRCDVLELDPNTLQPVGYPGHTALEWREMAQAIHDLNRKLNTDPIPLGIEARTRFHQPGKSASKRAGDMAYEGGAGDLSGESSHCAHCGKDSHDLEDCPHPPLFAPSVRQHLTLDRYLRTAHWNRKTSRAYIESQLQAAPFDLAAPLACVIAPDSHSEEEVARAVDCVAEYLRAEEKSLDFDWKGYWMVDFSQCPFMWALRPVDDGGVLYLVFNPTGSVVVRELVVTAEEALKRGDKWLEAERPSSEAG
jgi:hypothetical protein